MVSLKHNYKLITVGEANVGKTAITNRCCTNTFVPTISNCSMDYSKMTYKYWNDDITLHFWDTVGAERFRSMTRNYFRGAQGVFIVYDITNKNSIFKLNQWFIDLDQMADQNLVKILVGNKCDLESDREVDYDEGKLIADYYKIPFFEVSSKTNINFDKLIYKMVSKIYALVSAKPAINCNQSSSLINQGLVILSNNNPTVIEKSSCC